LRVLALDTTTAHGAVALVDDGQVEAEVRVRAPTGHSSRVLPAVAHLLDTLGLEPRAVEGYAVMVGPGSFTGLRVGISTVQGLALSARRPCVGGMALDVLAARIAGAADCLVPLMNAGRGEVFWGRYDGEGRLLEGPGASPLEAALLGLPGQAAFVGDAVAANRDRILGACPRALFPERSLFLAGTLGRLAELRLLAGEGVTASQLRPVYLRQAAIRGASHGGR
jgi:tRNA threonylcarbamoyladenosine biosynthesis protein TsaB